MSYYAPYRFWKVTDFNSSLKDLVYRFDFHKTVANLIEKALRDPAWYPLLEYDGCTLVQDLYHPCLSCFIHDYLWKTGQGGKDADKLFLYLMVNEGMSKSKAKRRYIAVRIYWLFYAKWKHLSKRNVNVYSKEFQAVLNYINKEKIKICQK